MRHGCSNNDLDAGEEEGNQERAQEGPSIVQEVVQEQAHAGVHVGGADSYSEVHFGLCHLSSR